MLNLNEVLQLLIALIKKYFKPILSVVFIAAALMGIWDKDYQEALCWALLIIAIKE